MSPPGGSEAPPTEFPGPCGSVPAFPSGREQRGDPQPERFLLSSVNFPAQSGREGGRRGPEPGGWSGREGRASNGAPGAAWSAGERGREGRRKRKWGTERNRRRRREESSGGWGRYGETAERGEGGREGDPLVCIVPPPVAHPPFLSLSFFIYFFLSSVRLDEGEGDGHTGPEETRSSSQQAVRWSRGVGVWSWFSTRKLTWGDRRTLL